MDDLQEPEPPKNFEKRQQQHITEYGSLILRAHIRLRDT